MGIKVFRIICIAAIAVVLLALFFKHVLHRGPYFLYPNWKTSTKIEERFHALSVQKGLNYPLKDRWIRIKKSQRTLELYSGQALIKPYTMVLGRNAIDDKVKEGDKCTPEGEFYICTRNPNSQFYLFLGISYPNKEDAERGLRDNLITQEQYDSIISAITLKQLPLWDTPLGGAIGIHGGGADWDWTLGCIALANSDIEELYRVLQMGDKVVIEK